VAWWLKVVLAEWIGIAIAAVYLFFRDRSDRAAMREVQRRYPTLPAVANAHPPTGTTTVGPGEWIVRPERDGEIQS
jgi:sarcosine oxidase gamma subunit